VDCKTASDCVCSTSTPTPAATSTSTPKSTPEEESEPNLISPAESDVLGLREELEADSTSTPLPEESGGGFSFLSILLMILGGLFIAVAIFGLIKRVKSDYNKKGETIT
jgi:hypothetical protein